VLEDWESIETPSHEDLARTETLGLHVGRDNASPTLQGPVERLGRDHDEGPAGV
jgi:hypothetical protein